MSAIDPKHYREHPSGIECIQVTEHMNFNLGNAVKYIWRAGLKGDAVEDLKKASWYIGREIKRIEKSGSNPEQASMEKRLPDLDKVFQMVQDLEDYKNPLGANFPSEFAAAVREVTDARGTFNEVRTSGIPEQLRKNTDPDGIANDRESELLYLIRNKNRKIKHLRKALRDFGKAQMAAINEKKAEVQRADSGKPLGERAGRFVDETA